MFIDCKLPKWLAALLSSYRETGTAVRLNSPAAHSAITSIHFPLGVPFPLFPILPSLPLFLSSPLIPADSASSMIGATPTLSPIRTTTIEHLDHLLRTTAATPPRSSSYPPQPSTADHRHPRQTQPTTRNQYQFVPQHPLPTSSDAFNYFPSLPIDERPSHSHRQPSAPDPLQQQGWHPELSHPSDSTYIETLISQYPLDPQNETHTQHLLARFGSHSRVGPRKSSDHIPYLDQSHTAVFRSRLLQCPHRHRASSP
ncbi:hypothetical protein F5148DRAFT_632663 [Russula earlei]|uniref:Uncharacterized protein n=1 Tax=Russula earlei TaxID=71964 RepID=A0ACC0TWA7_9AGAM|nr:hypothetical protein F5148DRAFT_632663 [Russula earlei]